MSRILREQRVSKDRPCPACGHTSPWCYFLAAGDAVWCGRASHVNNIAGRPWKSGWVHQLNPSGTAPARVDLPAEPKGKPIDYEKQAIRFATAAHTDAVGRFALSLGVSTKSLRRLGIGWASAQALEKLVTGCKANGAWSFPMRTIVKGRFVVTGIRLRSPASDAFKYCVRDGNGAGLFIPDGLTAGSELLFPEGPTSAAALLSLGFDAVGRPNCLAGIANIRALCSRLNPFSIVIVGDNDKPDKHGRLAGQDGAKHIAAELGNDFPNVRCALPPAVIKDCRNWLQLGADADMVAHEFKIQIPLHSGRAS